MIVFIIYSTVLMLQGKSVRHGTVGVSVYLQPVCAKSFNLSIKESGIAPVYVTDPSAGAG